MPLAVSWVATSCVLLLATLFSGCGQSTSDDGTGVKRVCSPGTSFSCVKGSCSGHQSCLDDGSAFTACVCNDRPTAAGAGSARDAGASGDEQCHNGKDDDGNGDVDCADSACSANSCSAAAPDGWLGPIALRVHAKVSGNACSGAFTEKAFEAGSEPHADAAQCAACECSGGDAACAAFVDIGTSGSGDCGGTSCTTSVNQACAEIAPPCLKDLASASLKTKLPAAAGACKPSDAAPKKPDVTWKTRVLGCALPAANGGGCKDSEVCLPKQPDADGNDYEARYCIWKDGDSKCPSGDFSKQQLYYRELDDTRGCTACACAGPNCSYEWKVFSATDTACEKPPVLTLTKVDQCVQVNPSAGTLRVGAKVSGDGKCTPSGGSSEGNVTGKRPLTVCCKP